jgi:hypothetical protein
VSHGKIVGSLQLWYFRLWREVRHRCIYQRHFMVIIRLFFLLYLRFLSYREGRSPFMNDSSGPFIGSVEAPSFAFTWSLQKPSTSSVRSKNINTQGPSLSANDITHDTFFRELHMTLLHKHVSSSSSHSQLANSCNLAWKAEIDGTLYIPWQIKDA